MQDGVFGVNKSPLRGEALGADGSGTRHETREDNRRRRTVKFLLP